ncbi:ABC transporter ATP-binding protein [Vibrio splendidus]|uniref:ABC transporter ATP-binding protein n=1 Tax=Vibrio sp. 1CM23M TaxID=2929164 RepID=UPI0020C12DBD|nr:ABC transporter ATP-binding protein [Vibrio sp. 1CM23M]
MLKFNDVSLQLGGKSILKPMSGGFPQGSITALIGPNGSGKSTLLSVLSQLRQPDSGGILLRGDPVSNLSRAKIAREIALMPQRNPVPSTLSVADLVAFGRHPHRPWYRRLDAQDKEAIDWAISVSGIEHYRDRLLSGLSGGELQRCWLAMVLAQDTPLLMLDEPTSWLDIHHQQGLLEIVKRLNEEFGKTIIWVLHDLNQALQYSDRAMMLQNGDLVASGLVDDVITAERVSHIYQTPVRDHDIDGQRILWTEVRA